VTQSTLALEEVETNIIMLLNEHVALTHKVYIAGNSVHFDKAFIKKYMPKLYARLHHRNLDVSAVSLFLKTKGTEIKCAHEKMYRHTALADIRESIDEYKCYLKN
jgi:oligoribonuclease